MGTTLIMISTITHAQMGRDILAKEGIHTSMVRTPKLHNPYGCGYSLRVRGDAPYALSKLNGTGVHVLGTIEENAL